MRLSCIAFFPALVGFAAANNEGEDISWMSGYRIRYNSCAPQSQMAFYRLCPDQGHESCDLDCEGGLSYATSVSVFIDAFTEAQMKKKEYACEMVRENCEDEDESQCYEDANLNCEDNNNNNENNLNVQEYLECVQFDGEVNDGYEDEYWVGPYCSGDAKSILIELFSDEDCTIRTDETFLDVYGYSPEFTTSSIINPDDCVKCEEPKKEDDQAEGDKDDEDDVLEQCEELYEYADRCESAIDGDVSSCDYIDTLLEEEVTPVITYSTGGKGDGWWESTTPLWIALAITIVVVCAMQCCLLREVRKSSNKRKKTGPSEELLP